MNDFWTAFAAVVAALSIIWGAFQAGITVGHNRAARKINAGRDSKRFANIYAPVYGFFTTCHITTVNAYGAPHFRQRIHNAKVALLENRRPLEALWALFDKQDMGTSGEVEYGSDFPLAAITKHLKGREQYADQSLLNLVARANRAQYEEIPTDRALTDADLQLFDHICAEHEKLSRRFSKA